MITWYNVGGFRSRRSFVNTVLINLPYLHNLNMPLQSEIRHVEFIKKCFQGNSQFESRGYFGRMPECLDASLKEGSYDSLTGKGVKKWKQIIILKWTENSGQFYLKTCLL